MDGDFHRGWDVERVGAFREGFFKFLPHVWINSKELGRIRLGDHIYHTQDRFLDFVFDALSRDVHDLKHSKSRQLGISTISRALSAFWLGVHGGLKGYCIYDTASHKEEGRIEMIDMIKSLPDSFKFPKIERENRDLLLLDNGSMVTFASAGTSESKSSGTLGRGSGVNFVHASEICSWKGGENLISFKNSLAQKFPDRLFLWESTGRGRNEWFDMCEEAKEDKHHQAFLFSGWWCREDQIISQNDPDFERYASAPLSKIEEYKIKIIGERYEHKITLEQLSWVRRYLDPLAKTEGDAPAEYVGDAMKVREQAWIEEDSWQTADAIFFAPEDIDKAYANVSRKFKTYTFQTGLEFTDTKVFPAPNSRSVHLKVWDEPEPHAVYVVSADVGFGANENNDRSAIQVLRCYADGVDQVAEYANPLITTRQFAWVILALAAWYAGDAADVFLIVELNGPGYSVWDEIDKVKRDIASGYQRDAAIEKGLGDVFRNVKNYLYTRPDSMSGGKSYHWKTSPGSGPAGKVRLMERLRDFFSNGMIHIRSQPTLEEMQSVARDGDSIEAQGSKKDDRVLALAFAIRCWEERVRKKLSTLKRTRENEKARRLLTVTDQARLYHANMLENVFAQKRRTRNQYEVALRRAQWRRR